MWTKFLLIVIQILATTASANVKLKGGLIYKNEGSAQINQDSLQYKRFMDVSALYSVGNKLSETTHMYETYCSYVAERHAQNKHVTPTNFTNDELYAKMKNMSVHYISTALKYLIVPYTNFNTSKISYFQFNTGFNICNTHLYTYKTYFSTYNT